MVYPNDYEVIVKALSKGLRRRGQLLSPEDALRLPVSGRTLWVTFSPTPDLAHAVARFWVVRGEEVKEVPPEVVFDDLLYHEGWGWAEALEETCRLRLEDDHQEENEEEVNLYI